MLQKRDREGFGYSWAAAHDPFASLEFGLYFNSFGCDFVLTNVFVVFAAAHFEHEQRFAYCAVYLDISEQDERVYQEGDAIIAVFVLAEQGRAFAREDAGQAFAFEGVDELVLRFA